MSGLALTYTNAPLWLDLEVTESKRRVGYSLAIDGTRMVWRAVETPRGCVEEQRARYRDEGYHVVSLEEFRAEVAIAR